MSKKESSSLFPKKYLIWFSICFIFGLYCRHWTNTGSGQFKRWAEFIN